MTPKGACPGSRDLFSKFQDISITFQRMKLDTSFFLCWIGHGKYYTQRMMKDPRAGVAKVT